MRVSSRPGPSGGKKLKLVDATADKIGSRNQAMEIFWIMLVLVVYPAGLFFVGLHHTTKEFDRIEFAIKQLDKTLQQTYWLAGRGKTE